MKIAAAAFVASLALCGPAAAQEHDHAGHGAHGSHGAAGQEGHAHDAAHFATARHAEHRLRDTIVAMQAGTLNYDTLTPDLAAAVRGAPDAAAFLRDAGEIQTLEHSGEPGPGAHQFNVVFANGVETTWTISINAEDKIQGLLLQRPS
ncbi:hypothetical protein [Brevundimonas sp.]|uniref:hypothetical protein n=1 Tax=Brevundimonas sp. TaxID=1871086 RepID=UPI0025E8245D|nr:hypothetical protein [Brevundimonas sp.]